MAALEQRAAADRLVIEPKMRFIDDGCSGSTLIRPELERLRDLASADGVDRLYVLCPDRLARKHSYQMLLMEELEHCGVEVVFLDRPDKFLGRDREPGRHPTSIITTATLGTAEGTGGLHMVQHVIVNGKESIRDWHIRRLGAGQFDARANDMVGTVFSTPAGGRFTGPGFWKPSRVTDYSILRWSSGCICRTTAR